MDLFQHAASRFGIRAMSELRADFVNLSSNINMAADEKAVSSITVRAPRCAAFL